MTKTELARLVRVTRALGSFVECATKRSFYCPVDHEWRRKHHERGVSHRFTVTHHPWESGDSVTAVTAALADHLDPGMEACSRVTAGPGI